MIDRKAITFDSATGDYAAYLDGQLISIEPTYHAAETALDEAVNAAQGQPLTVDQRMTQLAAAYQRARVERRLADAAAIKREALALVAAQHGVALDLVEVEYRAYRAERKAA